ncbi:MAG TPA: four helix bundle protein [Bacteroidales bacterium]
MNNKSYTEMELWKIARNLVSTIYTITKKFPKEEMFGLTLQMRRSAISIPSNIAEGLGRSTVNDILHFQYIARGSAYELETQLYLSLDQNYIAHKDFENTCEILTNCKKLLNGTINHYKNKKQG